MGCSDSNSKQEAGVIEIYVKNGGLMPSTSEYHNDFEKLIYMSINNCRYNPKSYIRVVKETAATN